MYEERVPSVAKVETLWLLEREEGGKGASDR